MTCKLCGGEHPSNQWCPEILALRSASSPPMPKIIEFPPIAKIEPEQPRIKRKYTRKQKYGAL